MWVDKIVRMSPVGVAIPGFARHVRVAEISMKLMVPTPAQILVGVALEAVRHALRRNCRRCYGMPGGETVARVIAEVM